MSPTTATIDQPSVKLTAIGTPAGGTFAWTSSDSTIATVSGNDYEGAVQPVKAGTATITVTYNVAGCSCNATAAVTVPVRNFVIVFGDPGKAEHNLGKLAELAAQTHVKEIKANAIPGVPPFLPSDNVTIAHISRVADLIAQLNVNNVIYLAYFGHGWNDPSSVGSLFIGQEKAADTNLTDAQDPPGVVQTCTSASTLPKAAFLPGAIARLYSCRGAQGSQSIAEQMAHYLGITVFGYDNSGGSIFTNEKKLGHGERSATTADLSAKVSASKDIWMIPADGTPHFRQF